MSKEIIQIGTLGLQHFCIKDKNLILTLRREYPNIEISDIQTVNSIDRGVIYNENNMSNGQDQGKNFILLPDLNNRSYLIWNYWDFNTNLELAKELSKTLKTIVNYYFVDPWIATSRWILTNEGLVTRAYYESHGKKLFDMGFNAKENELRASIEETFVEDIFWDVYKSSCTSLEVFNNQNRTEIMLCTGTLDNSKHNN